MSIKKAIIDSQGGVVNVISLPDDWQAGDDSFWQPNPGDTLVDVAGGAEPGGTYDGGAFTPRVPVTPPKSPSDDRLEALEKSFQVLVDKDIVLHADLPEEIKGKVTEKKAP